MQFKRLRDKAQIFAVVSSAACFVSSLWIAHFYLSKSADILFWFSFLVAIVFAALSFPRRKSLLALTIVAFSLWWSSGRALATYHSTSLSPDGRYKLVTYSVPMLFAFPGQGGDASGYIQLQNSSGRVLNEGYVEMVQIVYEAEWRPLEVRIGRGDASYRWDLSQ